MENETLEIVDESEFDSCECMKNRIDPKEVFDTYFETRFPLFDTFEIIANTQKKGGKCILEVIHLPTKQECQIQCIHTGIAETDIEKYNESVDDPEGKIPDLKLYVKHNYNDEIKLASEERFFAIKSFAQWISQYPIEAIFNQSAVENALHFNPISPRLLGFLLSHDINCITPFIRYVEKSCYTPKGWRINTTISVFDPIFAHENLSQLSKEHLQQLFDHVFSIDPPAQIFSRLNRNHFDRIAPTFWQHYDMVDTLNDLYGKFFLDRVAAVNLKIATDFINTKDWEWVFSWLEIAEYTEAATALLQAWTKSHATDLKSIADGFIKLVTSCVKDHEERSPSALFSFLPLIPFDIREAEKLNYDELQLFAHQATKFYPYNETTYKTPLIINYLEDHHLTADQVHYIVQNASIATLEHMIVSYNEYYFNEPPELFPLSGEDLSYLFHRANEGKSSRLIYHIMQICGAREFADVDAESVRLLFNVLTPDDNLEDYAERFYLYQFPESKIFFERAVTDHDLLARILGIRSIHSHPYFSMLFKTNDIYGKQSLAASSEAALCDEYDTLFDSHENRVLEKIAQNKQAKKRPKFATLFDKINHVIDGEKRVRFELCTILAKDPDSCDLRQFRQLFANDAISIKELRFFVDDALAQNPRIFEFNIRTLIQKTPRSFLANPALATSPYRDQIYAACNTALEKTRIKIKTESQYQRDAYDRDCDRLWHGNNSLYTPDRDCEEFNVTANINLLRKAEMNEIIKGWTNSSYLDWRKFENPYLIYFPAFQKLLEDQVVHHLKTPLITILNCDSVFNLDFSKKTYDHLWCSFCDFAENPFIYAYPTEIKRMMRHDRQNYVWTHFAKNARATLLPDIYIHAFKRKRCWSDIASNEFAPVLFPAEFRNLYQHKELWYTLGENENAATLFPAETKILIGKKVHSLAMNRNAVRYPGYDKLARTFIAEQQYKSMEMLEMGEILQYRPKLFKHLLTVHDKDENGFSADCIEHLMFNPQLMTIYPIIANLLSPYIHSNYNSKFMQHILKSPYITNTPLYRRALNYTWNGDYEALTGLAINQNAVHLKQFSRALQCVDILNLKDYHHSMSYNELSVQGALAENRILPVSHPHVFEQLLHHVDYNVRTNAFQNPSGFPIVFPQILADNPELKVNTDKMPNFNHKQWFDYSLHLHK